MIEAREEEKRKTLRKEWRKLNKKKQRMKNRYGKIRKVSNRKWRRDTQRRGRMKEIGIEGGT